PRRCPATGATSSHRPPGPRLPAAAAPVPVLAAGRARPGPARRLRRERSAVPAEGPVPPRLPVPPARQELFRPFRCCGTVPPESGRSATARETAPAEENRQRPPGVSAERRAAPPCNRLVDTENVSCGNCNTQPWKGRNPTYTCAPGLVVGDPRNNLLSSSS